MGLVPIRRSRLKAKEALRSDAVDNERFPSGVEGGKGSRSRVEIVAVLDEEKPVVEIVEVDAEMYQIEGEIDHEGSLYRRIVRQSVGVQQVSCEDFSFAKGMAYFAKRPRSASVAALVCGDAGGLPEAVVREHLRRPIGDVERLIEIALCVGTGRTESNDP